MNDPEIHLPLARLTADPEIRQSKNGTTYMLLNFVASGSTFDKQTNTWQDRPALFFSAFEFDERLIETYQHNLRKGITVQVSGQLEASAYQGKDGTPKPQLTIRYAKISLPLRKAKTQSQNNQPQADYWTQQRDESDIW